MNLSIDLETRSSADIKNGAYKYCDSEDFAILLFAYSINFGEVRVVDIANGEEIPEDIRTALTDDNVTKWAHNCQFERIALSKYLGISYLPPEQWKCSMIWANYLSLPSSLKEIGEILGLGNQKLDEGKELIRKFCKPPFKDCSGEDWELFKRYNQRDVEVENDIIRRLSPLPVPEFVWKEFHQNERINDRGVAVDDELASRAMEFDDISRAEIMDRLKKLTGLDNPNSVVQLKGWLSENGVDTTSLGKKDVTELADKYEGTVKEVLELRLQGAMSSVKKFEAMKKAACQDGRLHGMFRFYGATHTGRFSSTIINLQNLRRNDMDGLDDARRMVRNGDYEGLELLYDNIPDVLSQLVRTALIPSTGSFIVADYSAIEARVIAWLAGEQWRLDAFRNGEDIYCASASKIYGVPVVKHGENGHLRQKGKLLELACGYNGGVGAMKAFGADKAGLTDDEMQGLVADWRSASPNIVRLWHDVEKAAKNCIRYGKAEQTHGLVFTREHGFMFITLPSGRRLAYAKPRIGINRFGNESIEYTGITATKKWDTIETFGGKLTENITQAVARDVLCNAIGNLSDKRIVAHCHDELIIEAKNGESREQVCDKMAIAPMWADGLPLRADGYECKYYIKD